MDSVMLVINWIISNGPQLITAIVALLTAALAVALIVPGDSPDRQLESIIAFIKKFSKK